MADLVRAWVIDRLLADVTIGQATAGRVYVGHISAIPNPTYPCITLERAIPGRQDYFAPYAEYPLIITAWSPDEGEAFALYEALRATLHHQQGTDATTDRAWVVVEFLTPVADLDPEGTPTYFVRATFQVQDVGA